MLKVRNGLYANFASQVWQVCQKGYLGESSLASMSKKQVLTQGKFGEYDKNRVLAKASLASEFGKFGKIGESGEFGKGRLDRFVHKMTFLIMCAHVYFASTRALTHS